MLGQRNSHSFTKPEKVIMVHLRKKSGSCAHVVHFYAEARTYRFDLIHARDRATRVKLKQGFHTERVQRFRSLNLAV